MDYFHSLDTITFENKLHLVRSLAQFNAFRINTGPGLIKSAHAIGVKLLSLVESQISMDVKSAHHNNSVVKDMLKTINGVIMFVDEPKTRATYSWARSGMQAPYSAAKDHSVHRRFALRSTFHSQTIRDTLLISHAKFSNSNNEHLVSIRLLGAWVCLALRSH